jgi:DNA polymerase III delta prime subunit
LVILLAGEPGSGKSTFAPHLAEALGGSVLDTDDVFGTARELVGEASGAGISVVCSESYQENCHPRLLSLLLAFAATAASNTNPIVAVSPWTGFLKDYPVSFEAACAGLDADFVWVFVVCSPINSYDRMVYRGREIDAAKIAAGIQPRVSLRDLPDGLIVDSDDYFGTGAYEKQATHIADMIRQRYS